MAEIRHVSTGALLFRSDTPDLRGLDLRTVALSYADLHGADLRGCDLRGAWMSNSNCAGANFEGCRMEGAEVNAAKDRLLAHPDVRNWLASIWQGARDSALAELEAPSPRTREAIEGFIGSLARALASDEALLAQIEAAVEHVCLAVVTHRGDVGAVLADIVRDWDEQSITDRLELTVGSDLQFVRMTGTVVGASVGAGLFLLVSVLGWAH